MKQKKNYNLAGLKLNYRLFYILTLLFISLFILKFLGIEYKKFIFFILVVLFNTFLYFITNKVIPFPVEFDFLSIGIILSSRLYNISFGIFLILVSMLLVMIVAGKMASPIYYTKTIGMILLFITIFYLRFLPIEIIALFFLVIYTVYNVLIARFIFSIEPYILITINVSYLLWNLILFFSFGGLLLTF